MEAILWCYKVAKHITPEKKKKERKKDPHFYNRKKEEKRRKRKEKRTPIFISQDIYGCPFFLLWVSFFPRFLYGCPFFLVTTDGQTTKESVLASGAT